MLGAVQQNAVPLSYSSKVIEIATTIHGEVPQTRVIKMSLVKNSFKIGIILILT